MERTQTPSCMSGIFSTISLLRPLIAQRRTGGSGMDGIHMRQVNRPSDGLPKLVQAAQQVRGTTQLTFKNEVPGRVFILAARTCVSFVYPHGISLDTTINAIAVLFPALSLLTLYLCLLEPPPPPLVVCCGCLVPNLSTRYVLLSTSSHY